MSPNEIVYNGDELVHPNITRNYFILQIMLETDDVVSTILKGGGQFEIDTRCVGWPQSEKLLRSILVRYIKNRGIVVANIIYRGDSMPRLLHVSTAEYGGLGILFNEKEGNAIIKNSSTNNVQYCPSLRYKGSPNTTKLRSKGDWIPYPVGYTEHSKFVLSTARSQQKVPKIRHIQINDNANVVPEEVPEHLDEWIEDNHIEEDFIVEPVIEETPNETSFVQSVMQIGFRFIHTWVMEPIMTTAGFWPGHG